MSTSIKNEIIDVGAIKTSNSTVTTTRKLLNINVEHDYNIEKVNDNVESIEVADNIERDSDDFESKSKSDEYESDSKLSTTNDVFVFESDQSDSDDELKNIIEQNYIYHDKIKNTDEFSTVNKYLKHASSCTRLRIIQSGRVFKALKKGAIGLLHLFIRKQKFLSVYVSGPIAPWTVEENLLLQLRKFWK